MGIDGFARLGAVAVAAMLLAGACSGASTDATGTPDPDEATGAPVGPARPAVPEGPVDEATARAFETIAREIGGPSPGFAATASPEIADVRGAWVLADLLRIASGTIIGDAAERQAEVLTGLELEPQTAWIDLTNQLLAWDIPEPPGYLAVKRETLELVEPQWAVLFDEADAAVDWREVSWGGVLIDDAPLGGGCSRGCIPALDDPAVTDAAGGDWYPDDRVVFGIVVGGEARAYPKNIMEVHEMVNDTLGGRRLGIPYCTLCGSAEAFFTDDVTGATVTPLLLRTSGLLRRSNKIMYDIESGSYFDTFEGQAVSGPLQDAGVVLERTQLSVTTWADWKATHPETTIVAEDGGIGRTYDLDPLGDRDANGPIFPIGDVDDRLGAQTRVLGVAVDDRVVAFPVAEVEAALDDGDEVVVDGVAVTSGAEGAIEIRVEGDLVVHQESFWFAWSQFNPSTELWRAPG
ncbi:MAG: DUF3179 domain-containing protein [Acidimicrobiia bacterium]|nr:DUF3179 domain-containing protein [Acidimicrobiia bacterium]